MARLQRLQNRAIHVTKCLRKYDHVSPIELATNTIWPENLTGIKFDEIASKLHNKNMTDFKFDEMPGKKAHTVDRENFGVKKSP